MAALLFILVDKVEFLCIIRFMSNRNIIYGLTCPDTGIVRYVGKSTTGMRRAQQHKTKTSLIPKSHKNNWIKLLLSQNKMYGIKVIEECESKEILNEREIYWIKFYKESGHNLVNSTEGGEGSVGFKFNEDSKQQMSESAKKRGMPEEFIALWKRKEYKEENGIKLKNCFDCRSYSPLENFHKDKNRWDGLRVICKPCALSRKNKYYSDNIQKLTPEQLQKSYETRKSSISNGVKEAYKNNPNLRLKASQARSKPILQVNPSTGEIKEFPSALNAKEAGFDNTNIWKAIKYNKLYRGFKWKYK